MRVRDIELGQPDCRWDEVREPGANLETDLVDSVSRRGPIAGEPAID